MSIDNRRAEKEAARREDEARIARGEAVDNGFFSVLDRSKARIVKRRAHIDFPAENLPDDIPLVRIPGESDDDYDVRAIRAGRAQIAAGKCHDMSDVLDEIDRIIDGTG
ncbi:MAG: hypothetical protein V4602_06390 [Pseudomonadota bacterium]